MKMIKILMRFFKKKPVCDRCKGTGYILLFNMMKDDCPQCDGTGRI